MLYVVRDHVNDIVAICDDPQKIDKLREFAPETAVSKVEEITTPYPKVEDNIYVFHDDHGNVLHYSPNELDVRNYIRGATSPDQFSGYPEMRFKENSDFYGLSGYEVNDLLRERMDEGYMPNDFSADLDGVHISEYHVNYCYIGRDTNLRDDYLYGRDIDLVYEGLVERKPTGYLNGMSFDLVFDKDITGTEYLSPALEDWTIDEANGKWHTFCFGTEFWDQVEPNRLHVEVINIETVEGMAPTDIHLSSGQFTKFGFYFGEEPEDGFHIVKVENMICEFSNGHCARYENLEKSATKLYEEVNKQFLLKEENNMPVPNQAYAENNALMAEQLASNKSVLNMDREAQKTLHAPMLLYAPYLKDEKGQIVTNENGKKIIDLNAEMKYRTADSKNFLAAAEFMNSIGSHNPQFIPVALAEKNKNLETQKDATVFKMIVPYKDKDGNKQLREIDCYNMSQVYPSKYSFGKKNHVIPAVEATNHRADLFLRDMVGYGHARLEKGTFKTDNIPQMIINMVEAAKKNQQERQPFYDKEDARLKAVKETDVNANLGKNDLRGKFMQLMKANYEDNNKSFTIKAVKEAINQKWPKDAIKTCITELAPQAVYDEWRKTPYAKFAMETAEKQLKSENKKDKNAAR